MLKNLNEVLEDFISEDKDSIKNKLKDAISEGFKEKATLSIEKLEDGSTKTHIEGTNFGILIALAGLEKSVLKKLNTPKGLWELIKHSVGSEESK